MAKPIHSMIRVLEENRSVAFYRDAMGLEISDRYDFDKFTLVYLKSPDLPFELELTINKDQTEPYDLGKGYGHLAVSVDDLEAAKSKMHEAGATPGDIKEIKHDGELLGRFFFIKDPDGYSIEVLQRYGRFA